MSRGEQKNLNVLFDLLNIMKRPVAKIVVAGAGPAGLAAAIAAAATGATVTILEKMSSPGRKLLLSGGGRCNFTNALPPEEFVAKFGESRRAVLPAIQHFTPRHLISLLEKNHIGVVSPDGFHYFPASGKASDILDLLLRKCRDAGTDIRYQTKVRQLDVREGRIRGVIASGREFFEADAIIVATGGKSYPATGSSGDGYRLAAEVGHAVTTPVPALSALSIRDNPFAACAGNTVPDVKLAIREHGGARRKSFRGELLFTHDGVSGPVTLDISGMAMRRLLTTPATEVILTLTPDKDSAAWRQETGVWRQTHGRKTVRNLLTRSLPRFVAAAVGEICGIGHERIASELKKSEIEKLVAALGTGITLPIAGCPGFAKAMLTDGGVSLRQINAKSMSSRIIPGLYFAGEVMDVNGSCGGYNIHWAFASGFLAGKCSGEYLSSSIPA